MTRLKQYVGVDEPPVIEVRHLTKEYRLGAMENLRSTAKRLLGRPVEERQRFKALDDVSFSVRRGEVVGIIGHNGAGKSTLLKHLCQISTPTSGSVQVRGRVAPLIEVGAGLVGDMTGRENIYLNASILGLSRAEIEAKISDIVSFAELEDFIDTPVKRFSSGMQVRLGFSIATAVDCDVLLVDEVLAVGDLAFQQKCLDRISEFIQGRERTVLIVGHNIRQLQRICDRMIMLDHGKILIDDLQSIVAARYFDEGVKKSNPISRGDTSGIVPQESSGDVEVLGFSAVEIQDEGDAKGALFNRKIAFELRFRCSRLLKRPEFIVGLQTSDFIHVVAIGNAWQTDRPSFSPGEHTVRASMHELPVRAGVYGLRLAILNDYRQIIWQAMDVSSIALHPKHDISANLPAASLIDVHSTWEYCVSVRCARDKVGSI